MDCPPTWSFSNRPPEYAVARPSSTSQVNQVLFTVLYFLVVAIFYLSLSYNKPAAIQCQLTCSILQCQCNLPQMTWKGLTLVELSWKQSKLTQNITLSETISGVTININHTTHLVAVEPFLEESCFPTSCRILLGVIEQSISQDSLLTIICK